MKTELICVGTELLLGNIVNTNAAYISQQCAKLGLSVYYHTVVGDNADRLKETVKQAVGRSDVIIFCGGLGPTEDDLTKETVAEAMGYELAEDAHSRKRIEEYLKNSIYHNFIPESNYKQAMVPVGEGVTVLDNHNGTAPGIIMENNGKTAVLLPGPPNELIPMFEEGVYPYLNDRQPETIYSRMVKISGIGESQVEAQIIDMIDAQTNPTIATYAKTGECHIRVTAKAKDEETADKLIEPIIKELYARFGDNIFTTEEKVSLEQALVEKLKQKGLKITAVESCTGGLIASKIVNVAGASDVLEQSFVTYSEEAKINMVGVERNIIEKYGVVSEETARQMAQGGLKTAAADVALAVTGVAGPGGGDGENPVGTCYIACAYGDATQVKRYCFRGNRDKVREQAAVKALDMARRIIQ